MPPAGNIYTLRPRQALKDSKRLAGQFPSSLYLCTEWQKGGGSVDSGVRSTAKDEFFNIKKVTYDDLLAAHRVPPQLLGVFPSNTGGFRVTDTAASYSIL